MKDGYKDTGSVMLNLKEAGNIRSMPIEAIHISGTLSHCLH